MLVDEPTFELVTEWKARASAGDSNEIPKATPNPASSMIPLSHTKRVNLYSAAIINALQTVVKYYPTQELSGSPVTVNYPFAVLAHHYDELVAFKTACEALHPDEMCEREVHAGSHLKLLLRFLDESIMEEFRLEQNRNKNGSFTWDMMWASFKPGSTRLDRIINQADFRGSIVHSVTGGTFDNPSTPWIVKTWSLDFEHGLVGKVINNYRFEKFDGEDYSEQVRSWSSMEEFWNAMKDGKMAERVMKKIEYGKIWWKLLRKTCRNYKGKSHEYPHNEVGQWERSTYLSFHTLLHFALISCRVKVPDKEKKYTAN